jgi:hypothetical protein
LDLPGPSRLRRTRWIANLPLIDLFGKGKLWTAR